LNPTRKQVQLLFALLAASVLIFLGSCRMPGGASRISRAELADFLRHTNISIHEIVSVGPQNIFAPSLFFGANEQVILGPIETVVEGMAAEKVIYQWQKNGVNIPGASGRSYRTPLFPLLS